MEAKYGIGKIGFMPLLQDAEEKYGIIFKRFFSLISPIFERKKCDKSKFSWLAQLFLHIFIKIQPNMSE